MLRYVFQLGRYINLALEINAVTTRVSKIGGPLTLESSTRAQNHTQEKICSVRLCNVVIRVERGYVALFAIFLKSVNFSRIKWISETMVQFCYLRLYLSIETVSFRLTQRMARMDMD